MHSLKAADSEFNLTFMAVFDRSASGQLATAFFNINAGLLTKNKTLVGACYRTVWRGKVVLPA